MKWQWENMKHMNFKTYFKSFVCLMDSNLNLSIDLTSGIGHFELSFDILACPLHIHTFYVLCSTCEAAFCLHVKGGMHYRLTFIVFVDILMDSFGLWYVGLVNDGFLIAVGGLQL